MEVEQSEIKIDASGGTMRRTSDRWSHEDWEGEDGYEIGIGPWSDVADIEESLSEDSLKILSFLEAGAVISVLEDLYEEMIILRYVIRGPVLSWNYDYRTLEERFTAKLSAEKIFPEMDSNPVMTTPIKLQRDRHFIEILVHKTMRTLLEDGTFEPLFLAARQTVRRLTDEKTLVEDFKRNLAYWRDIKARVREKRRLEDIDESERDGLLYTLQDEINDVAFKCAVEEGFVFKWEDTRNTQNKWRLRFKEKFYEDNLAKLATQSELENRVTNELQTFIRNNQLELEEQLEEWMTRYDEELETRENKILTLKYERDQQLEEIKRLRQWYDERKEEIKRWIIFRELRKKHAAASLIIQAWWRAMMVRKKIGPYKPKKQKPEKK